MSVHQNYIAGAWAEAAEPAPNINPSNLSDVVGEYARANETQVRAAIAAARAPTQERRREPPQLQRAPAPRRRARSRRPRRKYWRG